MHSDSLEKEIRRRQRSLIPMNLVVVLLCIAAAISFFFMPLLIVQVDDFSAVAGESTENAEDVESVESAEENPLAMLDGMRISASFTGMDFIKITFAKDPVNTLFATVGDAIGTQSNELAARSLLVMASEASGREIDEAAVDAVTQSLKSLEEAKGEEAVDGAIENVVSTLKTQFDPDGSDETWNDEELRTQLRDMYDSTVQHNDGNFTTEAFICVNMSQAMGGSEGETEGESKVYTSFADLASGMLGSSAGEENPLDAIPAWIMPVVGGVMILLGLVWVILALFAFFRIFAKNKRFMMWYVKLLGWIPCGLFGVMPLVLGKLVNDASVTTALGMLSTLSWISGACYVLLWLVSIFWAFPIKHQIRKLNRQ